MHVDQAPAQYSRAAMLLHWVIAVALAFQCGLGELFAHTPKGKDLYDVAQFHKSVGIAILLLSLARLALRFIKPRPAALPDHGWAQRLASLGHLGLYAFMIGAPITGWLSASSSATHVPTILFNIMPWPDFPFVSGMETAAKHSLNEVADVSHALIAKLGLILFLLHIAGALRHQWLLKQPLLERMLPVSKPFSRGLSSGIILALAAAFFTLLQYAQTPGLVPSAHGLTNEAPAALVPPSLSQMDASEPGEGDELPTVATKQAATPEAAMVAASAKDAADAAEAAKAKEGKTEVVSDTIPAGEAPLWKLGSSGRLGFISSWSGTGISGSFRKWTADIRFNPDALAASKIKVSIDLASAESGDSQRDGMLQGEDFFNVVAHPTAIWTSTSLKSLGGNRYRADGTLSLRGVEKSVPIEFKLNINGRKASVGGSTTLNRLDFGIGQGDYAKTDEIPDLVRIAFSFWAWR